MTSPLVSAALELRRSGLDRPALISRVPRSLPPTLIEADYAHRLVQVVEQIRAAVQPLLDALPSILRTAGGCGGGTQRAPCITDDGGATCYIQLCASWFPGECSGGTPCDHSGLGC